MDENSETQHTAALLRSVGIRQKQWHELNILEAGVYTSDFRLNHFKQHNTLAQARAVDLTPRPPPLWKESLIDFSEPCEVGALHFSPSPLRDRTIACSLHSIPSLRSATSV